MDPVLSRTKIPTREEIFAKIPTLKAHEIMGHADLSKISVGELSIREGPWSWREFIRVWDLLVAMKLEVYWMRDECVFY